jgi:hypothetical protein
MEFLSRCVPGLQLYLCLTEDASLNEKGAYIRQDILRNMRAPDSDKRSALYKPYSSRAIGLLLRTQFNPLKNEINELYAKYKVRFHQNAGRRMPCKEIITWLPFIIKFILNTYMLYV